MARARSPEQLKYHREYMSKYLAEHSDYKNRQNKLRYQRDCKDRMKTNKRIRFWINEPKIQIFRILGGTCACCGETRAEFLSVDHKNGGGQKQRKQYLNHRGGYWRDILKDPRLKEKYQILCMNCNWAKGIHGYCPHEHENIRLMGVAC